jgi:hypothetical protein
MTKCERAICAQMRISESDYLATKRARRRGRSINAHAHPGRGRQVIDEASERLSASKELPGADDDVSPAELVGPARDDIDQFLADPDADGAYELLASAAARIESALERCAPPYSERTGEGDDEDAGGDEDEAAESGRSRLRTPFTTPATAGRSPGSCTVRVVDERGERIERLSRAEVQICEKLGTPFEAYAQMRAHRRVAIG